MPDLLSRVVGAFGKVNWVMSGLEHHVPGADRVIAPLRDVVVGAANRVKLEGLLGRDQAEALRVALRLFGKTPGVTTADAGVPSGCPMAATTPTQPGQLTYTGYLGIRELLGLQRTVHQPPHPDEVLFIAIHQAYELWFKVTIKSLEDSMAAMQAGNAWLANHHIKRAVNIMELLVRQIHVLDTMDPASFLVFRGELNPASGFQSVQFREIEFLLGLKQPGFLKVFESEPDLQIALRRRLEGPDLESELYALLIRQGYPIPETVPVTPLEKLSEGDRASALEVLKQIYLYPKDHSVVYSLLESLMDLSTQLGLWRDHHVRVVSRLIGDKTGTGGSTGVDYLKGTRARQPFALLMAVRGVL